MPADIRVGSPVLTINQGSTFMVTDLNGAIAADSEAGGFAHDTRFVSSDALCANGQPWLRLTSSTTTHDAARIFCTNQPFATEAGDVPEGTLALVISRTVGEGVHEGLLAQGAHVRIPTRGCERAHRDATVDRLQRQWLRQATALTSANEDVYRRYRQAVEGMGALRLYDHDFAPDVWVPAAGVPWCVTVFGRDSFLVSLQHMLVPAGFAPGALETRAALQATDPDDWRDAEPGKRPHESRFGELAHFQRLPHTPSYGTAAATPLYLIAWHEAWKGLGDDTLLREYRDVALRCLAWIDRYGDRDGDGCQEYRTRSPQGDEHMGWKDAADAVVSPDGRPVPQPKALGELRGDVFDAWMRTAEVFAALGEPARARALHGKAAARQARFEARFWCEDLGCDADALDPDKRPVATIASNAGHVLWSGLASAEHAARVVARLRTPDMWSGWGIRTLAAGHPADNPFADQRGSVWPHDHGLIALGFTRDGFAAEAARVFRDISEAASDFGG